MKNKKLKIITSLLICGIFLAPTLLQLEAHKETVEYRKAEYQKIIDQINAFLQQRRQLIGYPKLVQELSPKEDVRIKEEDSLLPEIITGIIEDENTVFSVTNSSYLNVTVTSTETVYMLLESVPRVISYLIKPVNETNSTILTITGLEPGKTYYRYQEGRLVESIVADESGEYNYTQAIEEAHHIYFLDVTSTIYIREDGSIEGTTDIIKQGDVYEIINDIQDFIIVERENTTIDGNGHVLQGPNTGYGIYSCYIDNIDVRNLRIENFSYGIDFILSSNLKVSNCKLANIVQTAIYLNGVDGNSEIIDNEITDSLIPLQCRGRNELKINVLNNKIKNCRTMSIQEVANSTISNNYFWRTDIDRVTGISIGNIKYSEITYNNISNGYYGISLSESDHTIIDNTNIISHNIINYTLYGIQLFGGTNTIVCDNQFEEVYYGIWIRPYHNVLDPNQLAGLPLRNVVIENNKINGTDVGIQFQITGNIIAYSENVSIRNNEFTKGDWGINVYGNINENLKVINYIEGNTITNHYCGIQLKENNLVVSENILDSIKHAINVEKGSNSTIERNTIKNSEFYGIRLLSITKNNIIQWNNFYVNNPGGTSQAFDDGINNIFRFNFWNDWTNPDENHDGYVDAPYNFDGNAENSDPYPLSREFGLDSDGDGLTDEEEEYYQTDPNNPDSDGDGLHDYAEIHVYGTNPNNPDTDADGINDNIEISYGTNPVVFDADHDADGLSTFDEISIYNTDPLVADSDLDGLSDGDEVNIFGTDPNNSDSDEDSMPDEWEIDNFLDPLVDDASEDEDSDDLTNLQEYLNGTDPQNPDTDSDGMPDGWEIYFWLNPLSDGDAYLDLDGDGLLNFEEYDYNTYPNMPDSDSDGLDDWEEVMPGIDGYQTDPNNPDTDHDGMPDGWEYTYGLCPISDDSADDPDEDGLDNLDEYLNDTCPIGWDTDQDELPDGWEVEYGTNPLIDDSNDDYDNDYLLNYHEYYWKTDPWDDDSDDDGIIDGNEISAYGTDPTNPDSDFDGISDFDEILYWNDYYFYLYGSSYWWDDIDGDGSNNILDWDSDGDNISDGDEVNIYGTNPGYFDTDQDTHPDKWEIDYGWDPLDPNDPPDTPDADWDRDGLTNEEEEFYGTNPYDEDSDFDGLLDGEEVLTYGSDPKDADSDDDGLNDWAEVQFGTDPNLVDTDGDGLDDYFEIYYFGTDPTKTDTDGDSLSDYDEWWSMTDPFDPLDYDSDHDWLSDADEIDIYNTNPDNPDSDGDGLDDWEEVNLGADGYQTDPNNSDTDGDGINDFDETYFHPIMDPYVTNPTNNDTDSDLIDDLAEINYGTDPTIYNSDHDQDYLTTSDELFEYHTNPLNHDSDGDLVDDCDELNIYFTDPLNPDSDNDYVNDGDELTIGTDPLINDFDHDNDGLSTLEEINSCGTNPIIADTDLDGMPDGWEIENELDPLVQDGDSDEDEDYLTNFEEYEIGTNPWEEDTDGDGLKDGYEISYVPFLNWYVTDPTNPDTDGDGYNDFNEVYNLSTDPTNPYDPWYDDDNDQLHNYDETNVYYTDPYNPDTDGDGLYDFYEIFYDLDPLDPYDPWIDSDNDQLHNYDEINVYYTDPFNSDSDFDGISDWEEIYVGNDGFITNPNSADTDEDQFPDKFEIDNGYDPTDPLNPYPCIDTDNDGLYDFAESIFFGTDPNNDDSDFDGMPDGWEVENELNPLVDDSTQDFDNDELNNLDEYNSGTFANNDDSDGDGMPDGWEVQYFLDPTKDDSDWDPDWDNLSNYKEYYFGTDPHNEDTDYDELEDWDEIYTYGTDPVNDDSDFDGMPDGWEIQYYLDPNFTEDALYDARLPFDFDGLSNLEEYLHGTDPYDSDTDNDGLLDGLEIANGTDPNNPDSDDDLISDNDEISFGTNPLIYDSDHDNDGLSTEEELQAGGDSYITDPLDPDTDGDGLTDYLEWQNDTNPLVKDTDGDGLGDNWEVSVYHTDPLIQDTDGDGLTDREEVISGDDGYETDPLLSDTDGDGLNDYLEWQNHTNPLVRDTDSDGLGDNWEVSVYHTDPLIQDTDGDGCTDYEEVQAGTNPLEAVDTKTPEGTNVEITDPNTGLNLIFDNIVEDGITTVEPCLSVQDSPPNFEFCGIGFYITTTADFTGKITIVIPYSSSLPLPELLHRVWDPLRHIYVWKSVPYTYNFISQEIIAEIDSFSLFALMHRTIIGESVLSQTPYYQQDDTLFVTSDSLFSLGSNISVPYFEYLYYRINGGEWIEYSDSFTISGPDGIYTIEYYGIDLVGVVEEIKLTTVFLVNPEISSYFTECEGGYFDVIFRKMNDGTYEYVTTNPGVFIYRIELLNNWPIALDNLTYTFTLPGDFAFSGTNPIHIYLDGLDITPDCIINGSTVTIFNIPAGSLAMIELHLLFAPTQTNYASLDDFVLKNYHFNNSLLATTGDLSIPGSGLTGFYNSPNSIVAHQKKTTAIAGFVFSSGSAPLTGALIELYDSNDCLIASTTTDDSGFFYFLDLSSGEFSLKVVYDGLVNFKPVTAIKDNVVIVNIILD